jgi:hypothetical protein
MGWGKGQYLLWGREGGQRELLVWGQEGKGELWNGGLLTGLAGICGSGVAAFSMHTVGWDTHSPGCHLPQH